MIPGYESYACRDVENSEEMLTYNSAIGRIDFQALGKKKKAIMPSLPLDLERMIFEMAALQDTDRNSRVRIILVAKRVYEWIHPILYRVAVVRDSETSPSVIQNWRNAQIAEAAHRARFVRHLLIKVSTESQVLEPISTFPNVENLAIWIFFTPTPSEIV